MAYEAIADSSADREGWLEARRQGIGGSDIPAIVGLSQWQTPLSIYVDKIGLGDQSEMKEQQKWGLLLEPVILGEFAKETDRAVKPAGKLLRSKELPFALCTLDATQWTDTRGAGNVQIKNYGGYGKWTDSVPPDVYAQVQWEMGVTEVLYSSAVALLNGNKLVWADVDFDDAYFSGILVPAALEFWDRVQHGDPPAADGSDISKAALGKLYPMDDGTDIELDQHFVTLDEELMDLKMTTKDFAARVNVIENTIRQAMGTHTFALLPNGVRYSNRYQERGAHEVKASAFRLLRRSTKKG